MSTPVKRPKHVLFVDDDDQLLSMVREVFSVLSEGGWRISTSNNHARALQILSKDRVDLAVLDFHMPLMDGMQFLQLIRRSYPGIQVVVFTGRPDPETRKGCLESGAALYLQKLITPDGFGSVFASLNALMESQAQGEFRGVMRRIGLNEVIQIECLGRKSSILEVFTDRARGRIYIHDGSIVHAESGALRGEVALYSLLALPGGEFNLATYAEPAARSISGQHEFLLMEAARLKDESSAAADEKVAAPDSPNAEAALLSQTSPEIPDHVSGASAFPTPTREIVLCTRAGGLLFDASCNSVEARVILMQKLADQAFELSSLLLIGTFDRLEAQHPAGRVVCQVRPDRLLFVQSTTAQPIRQ
jgi:DNA-binding response OmpR family regulator